jgi:nicotinamidase-related amidase
MKHALLVLDPQNDFFDEDNPNLGEFHATISVVNRALLLFHERGLPIIFIQHTSLKKPVDSNAWEIYPSFACQPDDIRLIKKHENAFWDSELDATLIKQQVDSVIITGYLAERCVLSTLRGALERSYHGAILEGGIASLDNRFTQFTLEISPHVSIDELEAKIG